MVRIQQLAILHLRPLIGLFSGSKSSNPEVREAANDFEKDVP